MEEIIFWDDTFKGQAKGGFFFRNDLFKHVKRLEENGYRVVGIKVEDGWNLEFICEVKTT